MMESKAAQLDGIDDIRNRAAEDVAKLEMPWLLPQRPGMLEADRQ
jgi:hypothetical protein